jgi:hypothetical protein
MPSSALRRLNQPQDVGFPLGDTGQKKFNSRLVVPTIFGGPAIFGWFSEIFRFKRVGSIVAQMCPIAATNYQAGVYAVQIPSSLWLRLLGSSPTQGAF